MNYSFNRTSRKIILLFIFILLFYLSSSAQQGSELVSELRGKKISLDIKGMDIVDVLKIFSMQTGLNIVAGKNVRGNVTIFLKDVDAANAFEIIMAANELAYEKEGNIVNVMTDRDYEVKYGRKFREPTQIKVVHLKYSSAADAAKALNEIKSRIGKVVADERSNSVVMLDNPTSIALMSEAIERMDVSIKTEVFAFNYAKVKDIEPRLTELVTKGTGQAKIDERTNKIIVTDTPQKIEEIRKIVAQLDAKTKEVLIEAKIIEITLSDDYQLGVDWKALLGKEFRMQFTDGMVGPFYVGKAAPDTDLLEGGEYKGFLKLLNTVGKTDILSTPKITAADNQEAKILVGEKRPFLTSETTYDQSGRPTVRDQVTFIDVGVKLNVTPTINEEGFITMKIKPEVSEAEDKILTGGEGTQKIVPLVKSTEAETTIMVKDGATVFLGGLIKDKQKRGVTKVPFLGDIPLLGNLFRTKTDKIEKSELVILLTPHIVIGEEGAPERGMRLALEKEQTPREEPTGREKMRELLFPEEKKALPQESAMREASKALERIEKADVVNEYYLGLSERLMNYVSKNYIGIGTKGDVQIFFTLKADGTLDGEPVVVGEVDPYLKNLAIQCVKSAGPYPNFPAGMADPRHTFNILLSFGG
ncbi:MAG: hypothetical protein NC818_06940 [Candidatus Omnitrophica bacterium]|nr:hypothetical protein [Candidatus Omnitrophota bacterium]